MKLKQTNLKMEIEVTLIEINQKLDKIKTNLNEKYLNIVRNKQNPEIRI